MKKKLKLGQLKVQSFITDAEDFQEGTNKVLGGYWTGNCGSFIRITCPEPCDFQSIPFEECQATARCISINICDSADCPPDTFA